ncbi:MAG: nineteen complex-related protein 2-domain-containing protein [Olpidium bornovanus]|uniref:Nineteen complex-related protein 2-domain-containing protein n=1 Tax=Olpidium bornovanus TaxID=278681 RepID=A0A8H7ZVW4_9FUNG|nr:MAG: nineteen complex-related protein 2-domain-containing protein [Olpidium bornovanus]
MFTPRNRNARRKRVVLVGAEDTGDGGTHQQLEGERAARERRSWRSENTSLSADEGTEGAEATRADLHMEDGDDCERPVGGAHGDVALPPATSAAKTPRVGGTGTGGGGVAWDVDCTPSHALGTKEKREKKAKPKGAGGLALSFGDEEEAEEVFLVKKSAASRRMAKNRTKRTHLSADMLPASIDIGRVSISGTPSYTAEHLAELRKNAVRTPPSGFGEVDDIVAQKFPLTFAVGGGDGIPDANAVHAARLRRKKARESGVMSPTEFSEPESTAEDFIPLDGSAGSRQVGKYTGPSRLVREEDELDDGEGEYSAYIGEKMVLTQKDISEQKMQRKESMLASLDTLIVDADEDDEQRDWEIDKIRKGGYAEMDKIIRTASYLHKERQRNKKIPAITPIPTMAAVRKRLAEALADVQAQRESYDRQLDQVRKDRVEVLAAVETLSVEVERESERYGQHLAALREKLDEARNDAAAHKIGGFAAGASATEQAPEPMEGDATFAPNIVVTEGDDFVLG